MANGNDKSASAWLQQWPILALALAAGGLGNIGVRMIDPPRPDPFTGHEGRILERRVELLEADHGVMREELNRLEEKVDVLPPPWFQRRVDVLEERMEKQLQTLTGRVEKNEEMSVRLDAIREALKKHDLRTSTVPRSSPIPLPSHQ